VVLLQVLNYTVIFEKESDGGYSVYCPALPGCVSQGDTYEEALSNIKEAITGYIKSLIDDNLPIPTEPKIEKVEVTV
jgi:predicted RNase H-like HicB family nuclease